MTVKSWLLLSVLLPTVAFAQFEDAVAPEYQKTNVTDADVSKMERALQGGDEKTLVNAVSEILAKDPHHLTALNTLGVYYFNKGKHGLAKIVFNRALEKHPDTPGLHNNLGILHLAEGDQRSAVAAFRKSLALKPSYDEGAINLSSLFLEYKDYSRALVPLEEGYKKTKKLLKGEKGYAVEIANNYAVALMGVGEGKKAKAVFENVLEHSPSNINILLNYAILLVDVEKDRNETSRIFGKIKFLSQDQKILNKVQELEKRASNL